MGDVTAVEVTVSGQVQGVGYRWHCAEEARRLGVRGWVRNEVDGTVHGHFEGGPDAVEALVEWCRTGPPHAAPTGVDAEPTTPTGARGFRTG